MGARNHTWLRCSGLQLRQHRLARAVLHDAAVAHHQNLIDDSNYASAMSHYDNNAAPSSHRLNRSSERALPVLVQMRIRLIEHNQARIPKQGPR
jgi:hypothetical protein